jgi:large subunit ribosomal protein L24
MKIKSGDVVKVISGGKGVKGTVGKVISVDRESGRVVMENGPVHKRHLKPEKNRKHPEGGIIERKASVHVSNVMLMSEANGRPVRTGVAHIDGKKTRVARGHKVSQEKV